MLHHLSNERDAPILLQGLQGWTARDLNHHFYPPRTSTSTDKLNFYSRGGGFGCVEVDSSNYSIPHVDNVLKWIRSTPKNFIFHFKAFGPLCRNITDTSMLPNYIKAKLLPAQKNKDKFVITELETHVQDEIWHIYNQALQPVYTAGKLGGRYLLLLYYFFSFFFHTISKLDYHY